MKSFKFFALEVKAMNPFEAKKATEQDPVMQTLKTTILIGWP